jgi:hypothetical protein
MKSIVKSQTLAVISYLFYDSYVSVLKKIECRMQLLELLQRHAYKWIIRRPGPDRPEHTVKNVQVSSQITVLTRNSRFLVL